MHLAYLMSELAIILIINHIYCIVVLWVWSLQSNLTHLHCSIVPRLVVPVSHWAWLELCVFMGGTPRIRSVSGVVRLSVCQRSECVPL